LVSPDTLSRLVYDVGMSLAEQGVRKLVIVNGHGGNIPALNFTAQLLNRDARMLVIVDTGESAQAEVTAMVETQRDIHGGEFETSTSLATRPEAVRLERARTHIPRFPSKYLDFSHKDSVELHVRTAKLSSSGVLGDPSKASREKGERMWEVMVRNMAELVEDLRGLDPSTLRRRE
jgi:creatinine amidohydrolase/Fe(II)-dependent formamide hydrolase-like protein